MRFPTIMRIVFFKTNFRTLVRGECSAVVEVVMHFNNVQNAIGFFIEFCAARKKLKLNTIRKLLIGDFTRFGVELDNWITSPFNKY